MPNSICDEIFKTRRINRHDKEYCECDVTGDENLLKNFEIQQKNVAYFCEQMTSAQASLVPVSLDYNISS